MDELRVHANDLTVGVLVAAAVRTEPMVEIRDGIVSIHASRSIQAIVAKDSICDTDAKLDDIQSAIRLGVHHVIEAVAKPVVPELSSRPCMRDLRQPMLVRDSSRDPAPAIVRRIRRDRDGRSDHIFEDVNHLRTQLPR
jgi:hypothetical protein